MEPAFAATVEPGTDEMKDLQAIVGGIDALMSLDAEPLANEDFDWSVVETQDEPLVTEVLMLVDDYCDQRLDDEYRTIARRILARAAARDPPRAAPQRQHESLRRRTRLARVGQAASSAGGAGPRVHKSGVGSASPTARNAAGACGRRRTSSPPPT